MFTLSSFIFILFTTTVYCQSVSVQFPTFAANTDIGTCTCDLTASKCDVSCCCDPDCSNGDQQIFLCSTRSTKFTTATPVLSTVQSSCYKDVSIFKTNSPYVLQKMGELVCVDFQRYSGSQYYQQPQTQTLNIGTFLRTLNSDNSVKAPESLQTGLTNYKIGSSVLKFNTIKNAAEYFSLPVKVLNNPLCSGSQTIAYMNDFTSTCSQYVTATTCSAALNPTTYVSPLCLIRSPSQSFNTTGSFCELTAVTASNFTGSNCDNALQSLNIRIFYSNPTGIVSINFTSTSTTASNILVQTFSVQFIQTDSSSLSSSSNAVRNPGYLQGSNIGMLTLNGSVVSTLDSSQFSILQPQSDGTCNTVTRSPIRFGENVRTTCKYSTTAGSCPTNLNNLLMPTDLASYYVAAYSNSNSSSIATDWLPVISCTSEIGSQNTRQCSNGILLSTTDPLRCYVKLDIQIVYTNIGSIYNPQSVLSSVIFHYQYLSSSTTIGTTLTIIESVTFQDISSSPLIEEGEIPTPNTRLPADFFFPFSTSQATIPMTNVLLSYVLISILFILM